jgi:predicted nucleic acid-binding protein
MSGAFFDTSALVPVVTEQLVNHVSAHARFVNALKSRKPVYCSTHTLAECYATLTALPLPQRISGIEAARLIEVNFTRRLKVIELDAGDYQKAIQLCADRGRISGQIYDALHLIAALKADCRQLFTYNLKHFHTLSTGSIKIMAP